MASRGFSLQPGVMLMFGYHECSCTGAHLPMFDVASDMQGQRRSRYYEANNSGTVPKQQCVTDDGNCVPCEVLMGKYVRGG